MKFIALKTKDGTERGKIAFYCRVLEVTRQGFYDYLKNRDKPWKYEALAAEMMEIVDEDECNDTYGRKRMHQALLLKHPDGECVPSESTVYRVMNEIGITHRPRRKPNGKIIKNIHKLTFENEKKTAALVSIIVKNIALDMLKKNKLSEIVEELDESIEDESAYAEYKKAEETAAFDVINKLPDELRQTIIMRYVLDIDAETVADSMGISTATVYARIIKARIGENGITGLSVNETTNDKDDRYLTYADNIFPNDHSEKQRIADLYSELSESRK